MAAVPGAAGVVTTVLADLLRSASLAQVRTYRRLRMEADARSVRELMSQLEDARRYPGASWLPSAEVLTAKLEQMQIAAVADVAAIDAIIAERTI